MALASNITASVTSANIWLFTDQQNVPLKQKSVTMNMVSVWVNEVKKKLQYLARSSHLGVVAL